MKRYVFFQCPTISLTIVDKPVTDVLGAILFCRPPENVGLPELEEVRTRTFEHGNARAVIEFHDPVERWKIAYGVRIPWKNHEPRKRSPYYYRLQWYMKRLIPDPILCKDISVVFAPLGWRYPELVVYTMLDAITQHAQDLTETTGRQPTISYTIAAFKCAEAFNTPLRNGDFRRYIGRYAYCPLRRETWNPAPPLE